MGGKWNSELFLKDGQKRVQRESRHMSHSLIRSVSIYCVSLPPGVHQAIACQQVMWHKPQLCLYPFISASPTLLHSFPCNTVTLFYLHYYVLLCLLFLFSCSPLQSHFQLSDLASLWPAPFYPLPLQLNTHLNMVKTKKQNTAQPYLTKIIKKKKNWERSCTGENV